MTSLDSPFYPEDDNWPVDLDGDYWWSEEHGMARRQFAYPIDEVLGDSRLWVQYAPDKDDMNTWPLFHVVVKARGWYWNTEKQKNILERFEESWYTRAPSPEEAANAAVKLTELRGDEVISFDFAFVPKGTRK